MLGSMEVQGFMGSYPMGRDGFNSQKSTLKV